MTYPKFYERWWRLFCPCLLLALVILSGCGFHLRGTADFVQPDGSWFVVADAGSELALDLRSALSSQGRLADTRADSAGVLTLADERVSARILSVDSTYQLMALQIDVSLSIQPAESKSRQVPLTASRQYRHKRVGVALANAVERKVIFSELRLQLVERILSYTVQVAVPSEVNTNAS